ncbi:MULTISPECIES: FAD-dependent oxidoreductase [Streptomyces]|uniref:FAD-dependent oxidoreductase n=1 Tax=Streptomyces TaxID=1883 RepID=UPI00186AD95C|nr:MULTISPECIES: FAD-dependent oxidoreductase [Streptomyces]
MTAHETAGSPSPLDVASDTVSDPVNGAPAELRWPGAVVVGGGVTALLTAVELEARGVPVLVIERDSLCSGQTGKCHGWLHRGAVFLDAPPEDIDQLDRGARRWDRLISRTAARDAVVTCEVVGVKDETRDGIVGTWERLGLGRVPAEAVGAGPCRWRLTGPETAIRPLDVLREILERSTVALRSGHVLRLDPDRTGTTATSVLVRAGQRNVRVRGDSFVFANGEGIPGIFLDADVSARIARRQSFMLVVRSAAVGDRGLLIPEQEASHLFAVPRGRATDTSRHLLVSDFISYAPSTDISHARSAWLAGIRPTLRRFLPDLWNDDDALWGVYPAVKVEPLRDVALGISPMAVLPTPYRNVLVAVPGKLTLAPLLAERLADTVVPHIRSGGRGGRSHPEAGVSLDDLPAAPWGPEEWEVTPLVRRETLFPEDVTS